MVMTGHGGHVGMSASQASASAGVSFAGVPTEMRAGAQRLAAREPQHPEPEIDFDPVADSSAGSSRPFGLYELFAPRRWAVLGGFGLLVAETVAMLAGPVIIQQAIDNGVVAGNARTLNVAVGSYFTLVALSIALSALRQRHNGAVGEGLLYDLRLRLFSQYQRLSIGWYTRQKTGALLSNMTSDVEYVALLVNEGFINIAIQVLTVVFVTVVLFSYSPLLATILLVAVIPPLWLLTAWFKSESERGYSAVRDRLASVLADLSENVAGIRVVRAFNRHAANNAIHGSLVGRYQRANLDASRAAAIYGPTAEGLGIAVQGLMVLVGGTLLVRGNLRPGELAAFLLFVTTFFAPLHHLVQLFNMYQQGRAGLNKIGRVLATEPSVRQKPDAIDLPPTGGDIRLSNVSFTYDDAEPSTELTDDERSDELAGDPAGDPTGDPIDADEAPPEALRNVSLHITPGETFALVGATGAGKSTVAKLITRFYDPSAGTVSIDGHDLRDVTFSSLRSQLGVVPQEPFLFGGSVRDNIAFAAQDVTDDEVEAAIDVVGLRERVDSLADGLDTPIHERGASLSAGERQLLALARAFVAKPSVVVLDEATSSLDLLSEQRIEAALDRVTQGRTTVLIAHRLATAMRADRIGVMEQGALVELGTHDELVAAGGLYAQMFATWDAHARPAAHA